MAFSPRNPDHIPEDQLWTLWKDERKIEARTRMVPAGPELRIYHNGTLLHSEVVLDGRSIGDVAEEAKAEWRRSDGWNNRPVFELFK